jgi:membrane-associated phospholipid phosphatase
MIANARLLFVLSAAVASSRAQDIVVDWSSATISAVRTAGSPPPAASRIFAIVHIAMHDAVNGLRPRYDSWMAHANAPRDASAEAAATTAARDVLVAICPAQSAAFDTLNTTILARIADGGPKTRGIAWGQQVATEVRAARANDGSANTAPYPGSNEPGRWRPHISFGGIVRPALLPLWGSVTPFALRSGSQFRPDLPPALPTFQYAIEVLITQYFGGLANSLRTPEQTEVARFWSYGPGTCTPPGHWNQIANAVAANRTMSLAERARAYALLNIAIADAAIVSWDCKYVMGYWRPITAIQLADQDHNPITQPDTTWMPLLETPPFPEYTSGHSTFSAAAAVVLAEVFGTDNVRFAVGSDDLPGVMRNYRSFSEAAWESGLSRVLGGIHFWSANVRGLSSGFETGNYTLRNVLRRRRG